MNGKKKSKIKFLDLLGVKSDGPERECVIAMFEQKGKWSYGDPNITGKGL